MAEVIGVISGIVGLIETTIRIYDSVQKDVKLPETFKAVRDRLPIISHTLRICERNIDPRKDTIPAHVLEALTNTLEAAKDKISTIHKIFEQVLPGEKSKQVSRYTDTLKRLGKGKKIERLLLGVAEDVQVVVTHDSVMSVNQQPTSELQEILQEMKTLLSEREKEEASASTTTFNSGGGVQYINPGSGFQIFNSGSGATQNFNTVIQKQNEDFTFKEPIGECLNEAPYMPDELFIGREDELQDMEKQLKRGKRFTITGVGGVGKTSLAITYAKSHSTEYTSVIWLNAQSQTTLEASFRSIASCIWAFQDPQVLQERIIPERVRRWLSDRQNSGWLLIFDNYDDPNQFDIRKYYPHSTSHGTMIIITRRRDAFAKSLYVKPLQGVSDSLKVLQTRSEREGAESDVHALRLAKRLAGLPLALATAGTYLRESNFTFERYLQEYEKHWDLDPLHPIQLEDYAGFGTDAESAEHTKRTLYATWNTSYAQLENKAPAAAKVIKILAFFGNQNLRYDHFRAAVDSHSAKWIRRLFKDEVVLEGIFKTLASYCFLEVQTSSNSWSMHNCVHDWVTSFQKDVVNLSYYWYAFNCVEVSLRGVDENSFGHLTYSHLTAHAVRLVHHYFFDAAIDCGVLDLYSVWRLDCISRFLMSQNEVSGAEKMMAWALATYEAFLGDEHELTLDTATNLAVIYGMGKKYDKATRMHLRTFAAKEKDCRIGPNHSSTLTTVVNLGYLYNVQGMLGRAEEMYSRALSGFTKSDKSQSARVAALRVVSMLGGIYDEQGKLDEAEHNFKLVQAGFEELLGLEHVFVLDITYDLGVLYAKRGKLAEAERNYKRAHLGYEGVYGPRHFHTLRAAKSLRNLYRDQGRFAEADKMAELLQFDEFGL